MKSWATVLGVITMGISVTTCFDPPEFPVVPEIQFKDVYFGDNPVPNLPDSIVISVSFTDGDGDLGLSSSDDDCINPDICYNNRFYFIDVTDPGFPACRNTNTCKLVNFAARKKPQYDTLPDFETPYNCINWEVIRNGQTVVDTLYFQLNPDHYNIFVDYLIKQPNGTFEEYDWNSEFVYPGCVVDPYYGRFPILFKETPGSPLEGVINYALKSSAFNIIFSTRTLKLRVYIKDRALNVSNVIETPEFTLQQIRR